MSVFSFGGEVAGGRGGVGRRVRTWGCRAPTLTSPSGELGAECIQARGPHTAELGEPAVGFGQRIGLEGVEAAGAVRPDARESGVTQHAQVLGDGRLADPEPGLDAGADLARAPHALRTEGSRGGKERG